MRLPKLDKRLIAIYEMLGGAESVCDIGADHGRLALRLAKDGVRVIATDISGQSLDKAERLAKLHGADVDCRPGDGFTVVTPGEVQAAVIAGMGQNTIIGIIKEGRAAADACRYLILQPMNGEYDLRAFLSDEGFDIAEERVAKEAGRLYCIMKARPSGGRALTEAEKHFGPSIMADGFLSHNFRAYALRKIRLMEGIARGMESAGDTESPRYAGITAVLGEVKGML